MIEQAGYLTAFLLGLFGGVHCVGMCGGIVGALTLGLDPARRQHWLTTFPYLLAYNLGRLLSYGLAGALAGGLSLWALDLIALHQAKLVLEGLAGLFMVGLGLYLAGWWYGLLRLEQAGSGLWRRLEPMGRRLLPVRSLPQALALGMVWGWLPCGLVYTALIFALSAASVQQGAGVMLSFGLGTLPTVMAMGVVTALAQELVRQPWVRRLAGLLVLGFGLYLLWQALWGDRLALLG